MTAPRPTSQCTILLLTSPSLLLVCCYLCSPCQASLLRFNYLFKSHPGIVIGYHAAAHPLPHVKLPELEPQIEIFLELDRWKFRKADCLHVRNELGSYVKDVKYEMNIVPSVFNVHNIMC